MLTWNRVDQQPKDFSYLFSSSSSVALRCDGFWTGARIEFCVLSAWFKELSWLLATLCTLFFASADEVELLMTFLVSSSFIVKLYHRKLNIYESSILFIFFLLSPRAHTQIASMKLRNSVFTEWKKKMASFVSELFSAIQLCFCSRRGRSVQWNFILLISRNF